LHFDTSEPYPLPPALDGFKGHCYFMKFPAIACIRSLKRTARDKALNYQAAKIRALSFVPILHFDTSEPYPLPPA
jgi:hypothetical protein